MPTGNALIQALRGALTPLALDQRRKQELEDELTQTEQRAQLQALLEAFKQEGRSQIQTQRDTASAGRNEATITATADRADKKATDDLTKALRLSRVNARESERSKRRKFKREAPEREREAGEGAALKAQRLASADASQARAEKDRRPPQPKPPKPENISTFDGFKQEVSNEVTRMMRSFAKAQQPMDQLRDEAIMRVVERNGGPVGVIDLSKMNERQVFNALRSSLSGAESGRTAEDIMREVLGGQ